nr:hypothetical protein [Corynebacterium sp. MSK189]MDK8673322.1 hypothetical protein [Corynebacterium sp. MSK189]
MTKTLADMTPQERAECVGMWCNYTDPILKNGTEQWIIAGTATPTRLRKGEPRVPCVLLVKPGKNHPFLCNAKLDEVAPLYDLPRAWQADGTPPQGDWEDDYTDSDGITLTTGEDLDLGPHSHIRRWVGEWEEA